MKTHGSHLIGLFYATGLVLTGYFYDIQLIAVYSLAYIVLSAIFTYANTRSSAHLLLHAKSMNKICLAGLSFAAFALVYLQDPVSAACIGMIFLTPAFVSKLTLPKNMPQEAI